MSPKARAKSHSEAETVEADIDELTEAEKRAAYEAVRSMRKRAVDAVGDEVHRFRHESGHAVLDCLRAIAHEIGQVASHSPVGTAIARLEKELGIE